MRSIKIRVAWGLFKLWSAMLKPQCQYLFILGHLRSGSTLLAHILMNHRSVAGIAERGAAYKGPADFSRLIMHSHFRRGLLIPRHFVLDQINHNRLTPDHRLLQRNDLQFIFIVRGPLVAIASQHAVLARIDPEHSWDAAGYYITRMQGLARIARAVADPERAFALTYEDLTTRTGETLGALTDFLQLPSPLSADYRTYRFTGVKGDPNDSIRVGAIHAPTQHRAPVLPDSLEDRAMNAYRKTQAVLVERCQTLAPPH